VLSKPRVLALLFVCSALSVFAAPGSPLSPAEDPPDISSRAGVLIDGTTGTLLFSLEGNRTLPPASLTKLMTIHLALKEIKAGRARADDIVELPPETWAVNQSPRSSLMFLAEGQRVTLGELLLGLAVSSGNDAAAAVALHLAPSTAAFVRSMNAEAERLSLSSTRFTEPAGISPENRTTALDFVRFCRAYLEAHPEAPALLHSAPSFAYPTAANVPGGKPAVIVQYNHNTLLGLEGVKGLKTGYIDESGYNIALYAERRGVSLIAVLLGAESEELRNADGRALLEWGFAAYKTLRPGEFFIPPVFIWKGKERYAELTPGEKLETTVSSRRGRVLSIEVELRDDLEAPLPAGHEGGLLILSDEEGELRRIPLILKNGAERGGFLRRLLDGIRLFFRGLFRRRSAADSPSRLTQGFTAD
jgi:D-alanyl-D-alanine carboxypeptidase (penicillin-binding protein 5/6)